MRYILKHESIRHDHQDVQENHATSHWQEPGESDPSKALPEHGPRYSSLISNAILEVLSHYNRDSLGHVAQIGTIYMVRVATAINFGG